LFSGNGSIVIEGLKVYFMAGELLELPKISPAL
jgi:hypothetical protein